MLHLSQVRLLRSPSFFIFLPRQITYQLKCFLTPKVPKVLRYTNKSAWYTLPLWLVTIYAEAFQSSSIGWIKWNMITSLFRGTSHWIWISGLCFPHRPSIRVIVTGLIHTAVFIEQLQQLQSKSFLWALALNQFLKFRIVSPMVVVKRTSVPRGNLQNHVQNCWWENQFLYSLLICLDGKLGNWHTSILGTQVTIILPLKQFTEEGTSISLPAGDCCR